MNSSLLQAEIASKLASPSSTLLHKKNHQSFLSTGIPQIDDLAGGILRGAITTVTGPFSSGTTTLMISALSRAASDGEVSALIDANNMFDATSAAAAGVDLDRLLWVKCGNNSNTALRATEMILQSGGFGLVILDLGDLGSGSVKKQIGVPGSVWYRFRRAIENTPTGLVVIGPGSLTAPCAVTALEMKPSRARWAGKGRPAGISSPLVGVEIKVQKRKPFQPNGERVFSVSLPQEIPD